MPKPVIPTDHPNPLSISRQRRWQIRKRTESKCPTCGKPSEGRSYCDTCAEKGVKRRKSKGQLRRYPKKSQWAEVDWSLPNAVIAKDMGVTWFAVHYQRKKRASKL